MQWLDKRDSRIAFFTLTFPDVKIPWSDMRQANSASFSHVQHSRTGPSVFLIHYLTHKQDRTKFWWFLPQSSLPSRNRQETSVALAWRGRRNKEASKKFGELQKRWVLRQAENEGSEGINTGKWQFTSLTLLLKFELSMITPTHCCLVLYMYMFSTVQVWENCKICHILQSSCIWNIFIATSSSEDC